MIYFLIALFIGTLAFVEVFNNKLIRKYKFFILFVYILFLCIFIGLRDCGFDYSNYQYYYRILHSDFWKNNADFVLVEKGYAFINYIMPSFRMVYIFFAIVSCTVLNSFIVRHTHYVFLTHFLLLGVLIYLYFMGQYRQGMAIPIVLLGLCQNNKFNTVLLIILASFVHNSALIALLALFVPKNYIKGRYYIILLLIALLSNILMTKLFSSYINFFPSFISQKLEYYTESEEGLRYGINLAMLLRLVVLFIFYKYKQEIEKDENGALYFNYYFLSMLIYLGLGFLPQLSGRGSIYFYIFDTVTLSALLYNISSLKTKMIIFLFFISIGAYRQLSFFKSTDDEFLPYKNIITNIF